MLFDVLRRLHGQDEFEGRGVELALVFDPIDDPATPLVRA